MNSISAQSFDVAVIGGGAIGLSCAWQLAARGARVVVFDRLQVGREASYAAGGMLAPSCEAAAHPWNCSAQAREEMLSFCFGSRDSYPDFAAQLDAETGIDIELSLHSAATSDWRQAGILFVPQAEKDPRLDALLEHGLAAMWRDRAAVFLPDDGQVESRKLVDALRAVVKINGVEIREHRQIRRLEIDNGRATGIGDDKETVRAERVLLCAGAWSGKIAGVPSEITESLRPVAGQMVQVRGERRVRHVIYSDACYLVPRRDGRLLIGATVEENGFQKRVTAGGVAQLLTAACELVPELSDAPLEAHWAGLRPVTGDGLPLLGATSIENLFVATGHGRNGILLAPATARALTALLLDGKPVGEAFSPARFALDAESARG